ERLRSLPVDRVMVNRAAIRALTITGGNDDGATIADIKQTLKGFARLFVINDDGSARYVLHDSIVYRDMFQHGETRTDAAGAELKDAAGKPIPRTLKDVLADPNVVQMATALAFVAERSTLADAKAAMDRVSNCRDVIVTGNGGAKERVAGWITSTII